MAVIAAPSTTALSPQVGAQIIPGHSFAPVLIAVRVVTPTTGVPPGAILPLFGLVG